MRDGKQKKGVEMQTALGFSQAWHRGSHYPYRDSRKISQDVFLCMDPRPEVGKKNKNKMQTRHLILGSVLGAS